MKIIIIETKTIETEIEVEADSVEQAKKLYDSGEYDDDFTREELEQWNVIENNTRFLIDTWKDDIQQEIKSSEQFQEEMEKGNPDNDFSSYEKGYQAGLTFAQRVVDKVFTKKRNHG